MKNKRLGIIIVLVVGLISACGPKPEELAAQTVTARIATESAWTATPSITPTFTETPVPTPTATTTVILTPTLGIGSETTNDVDGVTLKFVPEGEFVMGITQDEIDQILAGKLCGNCTEDWFWDEQPAHTVFLDAFWIYQTEVTNDQFAHFVESTGYVTTAEMDGYSDIIFNEGIEEVEGVTWKTPVDPDDDFSELGDHPVVHVSWYDAMAYCEWAGGRLPTEAEWEKAARGSDEGYLFPWGSSPASGQFANYCERSCPNDQRDYRNNDTFAYTAPVGSFPLGASPYGVMDMAGNVWEWVYDWRDGDYYESSPEDNPVCLEEGKYKTLRGGSWYNNQNPMLVTSRFGGVPDEPNNLVGFRCVFGPAIEPSEN